MFIITTIFKYSKFDFDYLNILPGNVEWNWFIFVQKIRIGHLQFASGGLGVDWTVPRLISSQFPSEIRIDEISIDYILNQENELFLRLSV